MPFSLELVNVPTLCPKAYTYLQFHNLGNHLSAIFCETTSIIRNHSSSSIHE